MRSKRFGEGEPHVDTWRVLPLTELGAAVSSVPLLTGATRIVAVDGRSASGKTSLAARLAAHIPGAAVVHTDDIAWWHSFFDWTDRLITGVIEPVRRGEAVSYRPPEWDQRDRLGEVTVPAAPSVVLIEGVGAGRRELAPLLDAVIYVQVDLDEMERRDRDRVARGDADPEVVAAWQAEEQPFLAAERPWDRAMVVVGSNTGVPHDPEREAVVAESPLLAP